MKNNIQKEIIELTEKLISFRSSELYPSEKKGCLDYIEKYFKKSGGAAYIQKIIDKDCTAIVISNKKNSRPDLLLNGHIDVVEGEDSQFEARKIKNRIYGRGAIDMKASVAVMMVLLKRIINEKIQKNVTLMIVADEEIPSGKSTRYLLKALKLNPRFAIVGEETGFDIVTQQKGSLNLKIRTLGIAAHSAFPEKGVNAIEKCIRFYENLRNLKCFQGKKSYKNTIALTYLRGGQAINSIPDVCEMGINMRFIGEKDLRKILNFLERKRTVDISIEAHYNNGVMRTIGCEKEITELKRITKRVCGRNIRTQKTSTGSDAKYFSEKKLPVIVFGPTGKNYHGKNEYVEISSLTNYYKILYGLINK